MPNWCSNKLCLAGTKNNIEDFFEAVKDKPAQYAHTSSRDYNEYDGYSFNALVPVPNEVLEVGYSSGEATNIDGNVFSKEDVRIDGYTWQIENWGTKWDAFTGDEMVCEINDALRGLLNCRSDKETDVTIRFRSAYSPPLAFFAQAAAQFPQLNFRLDFSEFSLDYSGYVEFDNGELVNEEIGPCRIIYLDE